MGTKAFSISKEREAVSLNCNGISLRGAPFFVAVLNCTLMEKFNLTVCPAHQGGIMGEKLELINYGQIGLKNNINSISSKATHVLNYYEKLLHLCFVEGMLGPMPNFLFDSRNKKYQDYFQNHKFIYTYLSSIIIFVEKGENPGKYDNYYLNFATSVFERVSKEMQPSLMQPYLLGIKF